MAGETLKTLNKALMILRAFDRASPELSVAEIARGVGESRTVVTRVLVTLERNGFVERNAQGLYRIGLAACEVGALYLIDNPLAKLADETLLQLARSTSGTAYLGRLYGGDIVILGVREGRHPIRFLWSPGDRLPVATTALGKAMLMEMSAAELDEILGSGPLKGLTEGSLRTRSDLDRQIKRYRPRGWMPMHDESYPGVSGVGAAIKDSDGRPLAGISLSFLSIAANAQLCEHFGRLIVEAAAALSKKLRAREGYGLDHLRFGLEPPAHQNVRRLDRERGRRTSTWRE
jgi:DNA-binding IclR family transcriptional regulator